MENTAEDLYPATEEEREEMRAEYDAQHKRIVDKLYEGVCDEACFDGDYCGWIEYLAEVNQLVLGLDDDETSVLQAVMFSLYFPPEYRPGFVEAWDAVKKWEATDW